MIDTLISLAEWLYSWVILPATGALREAVYEAITFFYYVLLLDLVAPRPLRHPLSFHPCTAINNIMQPVTEKISEQQGNTPGIPRSRALFLTLERRRAYKGC